MREQIIALYRDQSVKAEDKKYPDPVHRYTFVLAESALKYKPDECRFVIRTNVIKCYFPVKF